MKPHTVIRIHYHHGKYNSCCRGLDYPEQNQTGELHQSEDMDLPQRHIAQVDQIRLVLCRHPKQFDSVKELKEKDANEKHYKE